MRGGQTYSRAMSPPVPTESLDEVLADLKDYQAMNEVYGSYFPENPPARACVQAGLVRPEFLVEIASVAYLGT